MTLNLPKTLASTLAEIIKRGSVESGVQSKGINHNAISGLYKRGLIEYHDNRWWPIQSSTRKGRKGWDSLSPGYRARLARGGITKAKYDAGESIKGARGHSQTPERPQQAAQFPQYQAERTRLSRQFAAKKQHLFGTSPKWNPLRAAKILRDKPPPMAKLRYWLKMSREEWIDAIREDPETAAYLGYH